MIGIRADGNNKIGMGHIMRCLTIADALREKKKEVVFFLANRDCEKMVHSRGFRCYVLGTSYDDMEKELPVLQKLINELNIERLIIDSYFVTSKYLEELRKDLITVYLDDVESFIYPVDLLINYNVFAKATDYPYCSEYTEPDSLSESRNGSTTFLLAGPQYAPIRKEFLTCRGPLKDTVEKILITLGGSDAYNLSFKIATELLQSTKAELHVVSGPFHLYKNELRMLAEQEKRVFLHENVTDMWNIMKECDVAVSAAGSTMCELAVAGVPAVTFSFVENQRKIAMAFGANTAAIAIEHYMPENETDFLKNVSGAVIKLCRDEMLRQKITDTAKRMIDGHGAERIAEAVVKCDYKM